MSGRRAFWTVSCFGVMHVSYEKVLTLFGAQSGSIFVSAKNLRGLAKKKVLCRSHFGHIPKATEG